MCGTDLFSPPPPCAKSKKKNIRICGTDLSTMRVPAGAAAASRSSARAARAGPSQAQSLPRLAVKAPAVSPAYKLATLRQPATNS